MMESSKCKVQSSETEELKPCPFCGAELEYEEHVARAVKGRPILRLWAHPSGRCILAGLEVPKDDHEAWNSGCGKKEAEQTEQRFVIEYEQRLGYFGSIIITRDTETGKAYLFEKYGYAGGFVILEDGE